MENFENDIKIMNALETEIPKNLKNDFDDEMDDIFTKLGTLSPTNSSFDSPIILNRKKKFFNDFPSNMPPPLRLNSTNKILNYKSKIKSKNTVHNIAKNVANKHSIGNKDDGMKNITQTNYINYKNNSNIKTHKKIKSNDNSFRNLNKTYNNFYNVNSENKGANLPIINENKLSIANKDNKKIFNDKIENIVSMIKGMKQIDNKIKKKDLKKIINTLLINRQSNIYFFHESLNQILDYIVDILNSIKFLKTKSNYKVGNEKIILKLKNELKEKEKYIGELLNNSKYEQDKLNKIINTNKIEISNQKKEIKELMNKLNIYQKQISKIETNKEILEEKINKIIVEKTTKSINSSTSVRSSFIEYNNNKQKLDNPIKLFSNLNESQIDCLNTTQPLAQRFLPPSEQNKNMNIVKLNEKYNLSKKLNMSLLNLLKEINNLLCFYDSFINKENAIIKNKILGNNIKNLVNSMDINDLLEENKTKNFHNEFMRNAEIVFKKMEEFINGINNKNDKGLNKISKNNTNNETINKSKTIKQDKDKFLTIKKRTKTLGNLKPK